MVEQATESDNFDEATIGQAKAKLVCPFIQFGCDFKGAKLKQLKQHVKESPTMHLAILCDGLNKMRLIYDQMRLKYESVDRLLENGEHRWNQLELKFSSHLVWRIDSCQNKFRDARMNRVPVIFSPPFYTSRQGYKLIASICPNGDGEAKNQYLSIFMSICKGEFDNLLTWPFPHKITFTIMDQPSDPKTGRKSISRSFEPNTHKENTPFLGKPTGDRNPCFGLRQFAPLVDIQEGQYIAEDVMFIKIHITMDEMVPL